MMKQVTKLQMDIRLLKQRVAMLERLLMQPDDVDGDDAERRSTGTGNVVRLRQASTGAARTLR